MGAVSLGKKGGLRLLLVEFYLRSTLVLYTGIFLRIVSNMEYKGIKYRIQTIVGVSSLI